MQILNCDVEDTSDSELSTAGQPLDLLAWAFLRPLGANGRPNAGCRKQRLQLYEPIVSGSRDMCCGRSSLKRILRSGKTPGATTNDKNTIQDPAIKAGSELMTWWKAGKSHRIKYPSTLYVSINGLKASETLSAQPQTVQSSDTALKSELDQRDELSSRMSRSLLSPQRHSDRITYSLWERDKDQPCRVPNLLIGSGVPWATMEEGDRSHIGKWSVIGTTSRTTHGAQCVRFSPNGLWLAVGSISTNPDLRNTETNALDIERPVLDCAVWLYRYPMVARTSSPALQFTGHTRTVYAIEWAPTPVSKDNLPAIKPADVRASSSSVLSWPLASASADGTVRVWWVSPGLLNGTMSGRKTAGNVRRPTIVSPSETSALYSPPHIVRGSVHAGETSHKGVFCAVLGHPGFVYSLSFRPVAGNISSEHMGDPLRDWFAPQTSHMLATAGYDQCVRLWRIGSRRAEGCVINHVEVHPTQPLLLVHTRDSNPKMIDLRS
ncbi:hypothetical protein D915_005770 [Fasciola hepatica]|uniref:WD domain, G-beta repeat protein n=1 Tax=Fasciola hepatica TaxID=6192 RepID=A0A4E0RBK8_FASHE|nr:hypothetical protein D915_005770 [Fasciola hepatica]